MWTATWARALASANSRASGSLAVSRSVIMRLRSAARVAMAISGRRAANHSTCCNFIRSQGGLPITASNPPCSPARSHADHTPGNATCQLRNRSSAMNRRAASSSTAKCSSSLVCATTATGNRRTRSARYRRSLPALHAPDFRSSPCRARPGRRASPSRPVRAPPGSRPSARRDSSLSAAAERNRDGITEGAGKEVGVERRFFFSVADVQPFEGLDQREDGI